MTDTQKTIAPIVYETYGNSQMAKALIVDLAKKIDGYQPQADDGDYGRSREYVIHMTCWNFFSGGTTAESVARKIEEALNA